jgi:protein-disulfide isomerase
LQSGPAFWSLHDQLFANQQTITVDNIKERLSDYARESRMINTAEFKNCLDNELSLGLVFRDENLATANNVNGTPTLFVNGRRISGVKDAADLRMIIDQAEAQRTTGDLTEHRAIAKVDN